MKYSIHFLSILLIFFFKNTSYAQLTCSGTSILSTCSANGSITANAQGGSGSYNYQLSAPSGCLPQSILQSSPVFNALKPCTYTLTINDLVSGAQCQSIVTVGGNYVLPNLSLVTTNCKITANVTGGNDPFIYSYSTVGNSGPFIPNNPPTKKTFNNLPVGTVWIQVQDSCGNTFTQQSVIGSTPISGFNMVYTGTTLTVNGITGGNAPFNYKVVNNSGTVTNTTGIFSNLTIDCVTKVTVSDSCSSKLLTYNIPSDGKIDCVNFTQGTANLSTLSGIPPFTFQMLSNNVVLATSTTGVFTGLPTAPALKKYDFKIIDACGKVKNLSIEALKPNFSGTVACGTGGNLNLQILRNNGVNNPLFFPINISSPTANPTNITLNSPTNQTNFSNLSGNPNIFTIQNACGEKVICKDSLILNLNTNCVNIVAAMKKLFTCDNQTVQNELNLVGAVTYTLFDAQGNIIATNNNGNFVAPSAGTYTITATHPTCGTLTKTITINPGAVQINPTIDVMIRYRLINGKCVPRYTVKFSDNQGPYFINGANNVSQYLNTSTGGFYSIIDIPPGSYSLTSTTFCTSIPLNLPTPSYNMTAQVVQSCPGDAQIQVTGAYDFNYWKNWLLTTANLNLSVYNGNGGPHKDFYTTTLSNNFTNFTGNPYTIKNLNPGQNYTIYLYPFDAKESGGGCAVDTATVNIPAYNQLKVAASRGIICDGQTTADIKVWVLPTANTNLASGKKPYTYRLVSCSNLVTPIGNPIISADTLITFPNLPQGTHCIRVQDACGVSADYQVEVGPLGAGQYIGINCGVLRLQVDTIPGAIYNWKNLQTGQNIGNSYFVNIPTPASQASFSCDIMIANCNIVRNIVIPAGVGQVAVNIQPNGSTSFCQGQNVDLKAVGNANTYTWSTGQTGISINVSTSGNYQVTATNLFGCTKTDNINIDVTPPVKADILPQDVICYGQNNGQIFTQNINNQQVSYLWSNGANTPNISNLSPNNYFLTVTDNKNCKTIFSANINQPTKLNSQLIADNITCFGNQNGTATATPSGGTAPYTYAWSNAQNSQKISNLSAGTFIATVTDIKGCKTENSVNILEPQPLILTTNPQNPTVCIGEKIDITATPQGGNGNFTFLWSNGANTATQNLAKGKYSVTVTDQNGCKASKNFDIIETTSVSVPFLNNPILCEGTIKNLSIGGNFKSFKWSTGATSSNITVSVAQQYCVTVTTQGGCLGDTCINITQVPNPQPLIIGDTLICEEGKTVLKVTKSFVKYAWNNNLNTQNINVNVGKYQVTVTDNNGCLGKNNIEILPRKKTPVGIFQGKNLCDGDSVLLKANSNALDFLWDNGKKGSQIFASKKGKYCVKITDKFGCLNDTCLNISSFPLPIFSILGDSIFCKKENVKIACDQDFPKYEWSNGEKNKFINASQSGLYKLKVEDKNGCSNQNSILIKEKPLPIFSILGDSSFCFGKKITINIDKNFPKYEWSSGEKTSQITITKAGKYKIEVTDSLGCKNQGNINIIENPLPKPQLVGIPAICNKANTTLSLNEDFEVYNWSNNEKNKSITISKSGTYVVSVIDKNGCEAATNIAITDIPKISPLVLGNFIFCEGGKSELELSQKFAKYQWSNGKNDSQLSVNQSGNYCITVTDQNGCQGDTCVKITVNPLPKAKIDGKNLICGNQQTTLKITPPNLQYLWSTGEKKTLITVNSGTYKVTFTDNNSCSDSIAYLVKNAPEVLLDIKAVLQDNNMSVSCFGAADGKAEATIKSGTPPFNYLWNTGEKTFSIQKLKAGKYQITVTDALGCSQIDSVFLEEPPVLNVVSKANPTKCFGEKNGFISLEKISGGNGDFTYQLDNQPFTKITTTPFEIKNLKSSNYSLVVKDKKGCTVKQNLTIDSPAKFTLKIPTIDTIIVNDSIQIKPILNFVPDSIFWSPGNTLSCNNCLFPYVKPKQFSTTYKLAAWQKGCPAFGELEVFSQKYRKHNVFIPNVFSPNDDTKNDIFTIYHNPTIAEIKLLRIYDRWGELLWEGHHFQAEKLGWNGYFRDKAMNPAVFVYVAEVLFKDGEKEIFVGDFTLVR